MATHLSDLQTTFTIFDLPAETGISRLSSDLRQADALHLDQKTCQLLDEQIKIVDSFFAEEVDAAGGGSAGVVIPPSVRANLLVTWAGSTGSVMNKQGSDRLC